MSVHPVTTAADISPEAVERMAQFLPIAHMQEELDKAAAMLRALRSALTARALPALHIDTAKFMNRPPCYICGYNGPGYFDSVKHPCAAHYHAAMEKANG